jgi:hypothetical protein
MMNHVTTPNVHMVVTEPNIAVIHECVRISSTVLFDCEWLNFDIRKAKWHSYLMEVVANLNHICKNHHTFRLGAILLSGIFPTCFKTRAPPPQGAKIRLFLLIKDLYSLNPCSDQWPNVTLFNLRPVCNNKYY